MTRAELRDIVDNNSTKKGRIFDYIVEILIFVSLTGYALETLPDNSPATKSFLKNVEVVAAVFFTIEYLLRIYIAKKPLKYIFSFYGIIDFLAIFPFFLAASTELIPLRAFRIFRIFRAFKLVRYNKALKRFHRAWVIIKEEVILFLIVTGIFLFLASAGIYYFENQAQPDVFSSIFSSGWWAIVTLTTVGYGDVYPVTTGGKLFTFLILMIGVGIVTIPAGLVASALNKAREVEQTNKENEENQRLEDKNEKEQV